MCTRRMTVDFIKFYEHPEDDQRFELNTIDLRVVRGDGSVFMQAHWFQNLEMVPLSETELERLNFDRIEGPCRLRWYDDKVYFGFQCPCGPGGRVKYVYFKDAE